MDMDMAPDVRYKHSLSLFLSSLRWNIILLLIFLEDGRFHFIIFYIIIAFMIFIEYDMELEGYHKMLTTLLC